MQQSKLKAAKSGMSHEARAGADKAQDRALKEMGAMDPVQAGGFLAGVALDLGRGGALGKKSSERLARMVFETRKEFDSQDDHLEFMLWVRGGLAAACCEQQIDAVESGREFARAYAVLKIDGWADLMMTEAFYSTEDCPNADDMALIVEELDAATATVSSKGRSKRAK